MSARVSDRCLLGAVLMGGDHTATKNVGAAIGEAVDRGPYGT